MKKLLILIYISLFLTSCEKTETIDNNFDLLIRRSWIQFFGTHNGINYPPLKSFEKVNFNSDKSFELIIPEINGYDSVWGTFLVENDTIVMNSFRNLNIAYDQDGTIMYKIVLNYEETWAIIELDDEYLVVDNKFDNYAFIHQ